MQPLGRSGRMFLVLTKSIQFKYIGATAANWNYIFPFCNKYLVYANSYLLAIAGFLATLVALHFTPVSKSLGHSFELA